MADKRTRAIRALVDTALENTGLEGVYNDTEGDYLPWTVIREIFADELREFPIEGRYEKESPFGELR